MRIYVGNLSRDISEDELRDAFHEFGKVDEVSIIKDRESNVSKGFAFVEMPGRAEAEAAITGLKGRELKGRAIDLSEAKPRTERTNRGGGGGGGWNRNRSGGSGGGGGRSGNSRGGGSGGGGRRSW